MKTVNLNSVTLIKNGTPIELMGVTDKEKPWTLKGMITTENKDGGCIVDLSGCSELMVLGGAESTQSQTLTYNGYNYFLAAGIASESFKSFFATWKQNGMALVNEVCVRHANYSSQVFTVKTDGYTRVGLELSTIKTIHLSEPRYISSCDVKIYAR